MEHPVVMDHLQSYSSLISIYFLPYLKTMVAVSGEIPMANRYASKFSFPMSFHDPSSGINCRFLQFPNGGSTMIFHGSSSMVFMLRSDLD